MKPERAASFLSCVASNLNVATLLTVSSGRSRQLRTQGPTVACIMREAPDSACKYDADNQRMRLAAKGHGGLLLQTSGVWSESMLPAWLSNVDKFPGLCSPSLVQTLVIRERGDLSLLGGSLGLKAATAHGTGSAHGTGEDDAPTTLLCLRVSLRGGGLSRAGERKLGLRTVCDAFHTHLYRGRSSHFRVRA